MKKRQNAIVREISWLNQRPAPVEKTTHFTLIDARDLFSKRGGHADSGPVLKIIYLNKTTTNN